MGLGFLSSPGLVVNRRARVGFCGLSRLRKVGVGRVCFHRKGRWIMEGDRVEGEGVVVDRGATIRMVVCLAGWAALVSFAVFFAPGTDENTKEIILELIK